jgi:lysozyme family protein
MEWLKRLIRKILSKNMNDSKVETVPPVVNPEIPTKEEVENFPAPIKMGKWQGMEIDKDRIQEVKDVLNWFIGNKYKYQQVEKICGVPAELVCALHYRESSLSFRGVLHNGEKILNTGKKTRLVPKGRGPFQTWEEAAIDALMLKKGIMPKAWDFESMMQFAEKFNGMGYRSKIGDSGKIEHSPYIAAGTNFHDETGKYVADGKYSQVAKEKQLGVGAILIGLYAPSVLNS